MRGKKTLVAVGLLMPVYFAYSQDIRNAYGSRMPFSPPAGPITITPDPSEPVVSLDSLIKQSPVILEGLVTTTFPPIVTSQDHPGSVVTASLVTIHSVLHGRVPTGNQILLVELGGKQGKWDVMVPGNPLVNVGESYFLFLDPYHNTVPNSTGVIPDEAVIPRFYSVGYSNGKARIDTDGTIKFAAGSIPELLQYNGHASSLFMSALTDLLNAIYAPPPPYPVGTAPIPLPSNTLFPPGKAK